MPINKHTIDKIQQHISGYKQSGRNITLVAVTKTRTIANIEQLLSLGITHIAENKLQEIEQKFSQLPQNCVKHMIGQLQSNKVKKAVQFCDVIQSVDSLRLAELINIEAEKQKKIQQIMIQINIGNEQQKRGIKIDEISTVFEQIINSNNLHNLNIIGIMCIAPDINIYGEQKVRDCFRKMKQLFDQLNKDYNAQFQYLSMGMSDDYIIALEEGSNMVRIGRKLFD
ncbi:YggS family pyridoxal phosphate-dependent enzyme [Candidatus Woesearchaeota archaeon]|nr:YggS family pyridoxal phosphate-dependent enzyme [Candidatus Woesearchaeota archaeon]